MSWDKNPKPVREFGWTDVERMADAAEKIAALMAENERLREALRKANENWQAVEIERDRLREFVAAYDAWFVDRGKPAADKMMRARSGVDEGGYRA